MGFIRKINKASYVPLYEGTFDRNTILKFNGALVVRIRTKGDMSKSDIARDLANEQCVTRPYVIVSGSSGFIGSFMCEYLESVGYNTVKLDIRAENHCDLTDPVAVGKWFEVTKAERPTIFALVNCVGIPDVAGGQSANDITEISNESFQTHVKVNLEAVFTLMREFVRHYRDSAGHIVNISSLYSIVAPRLDMYGGNIKHPGYIASKTGLVGLSKYCAVLCAKDNIKVNCVAPAAVADTKGVEGEFLRKYNSNVPLQRPIPLQECAETVAFLLRSENITGQNLVVDGGYSLW